MTSEHLSRQRLQLVEAVFTDLDGTAIFNGASPNQVQNDQELLEAIKNCPVPVVPVTGRTQKDGGQAIGKIISDSQEQRSVGYVFEGGSYIHDNTGNELSFTEGEYENTLDYLQLFHLYAAYADHMVSKAERDRLNTSESLRGKSISHIRSFYEAQVETKRFSMRTKLALAGIAIGHGYSREHTIAADGTFIEIPGGFEEQIADEGEIRGSFFARDLPSLGNAKRLAGKMIRVTKGSVSATAVTSQNQGMFDVHVVNARGDKAAAVKCLAEIEDLRLGRSILVGDGMNDISMFGIGYPSIAMGNAPNEVKEVADVVIGTQQEGAFIDLLERITAAKKS